MVVSATIERHEVAPVTDIDWDFALKHYAKDRPSRGDASHPKILHCGCPPSAYTDNCDRLDLRRSASDLGRAPRHDLSPTHPYAQPLMTHGSSSSTFPTSIYSPENANPLIHEATSLEDDLSSFSGLTLEQTPAKPLNLSEWRRHHSPQARDLTERPEFPPVDLSLTRCQSQPGRERKPSLDASAPESAVPMAKSPSTTILRQALTLEEKDAAMRRAAHPARRQQSPNSRLSNLLRTPGPALNYPYPVPERDGLPRPINVDEDPGHLCMGAERLRLRGIYEDEGWLPAPNPSQATRVSRATAIRRLGLTENNDEQYAVIAKYAETAAMIFQAKYGFVCLLRGDIEEVYLPNYKQHKITFPLSSSLIGHAVLTPSEKCFVVADFDKDWRFARHPARIGERKTRFMAAAPLRFFHSNGDYADFGSLVVFDPEPRDTFDEREQNILLRLANMCVFQLATLQSERMAKRSSGMYEASIGFLRRSLVPDVNPTEAVRSPTERTAEARKARRRPPEKRGSLQSSRRHSTPPSGPIVSQRPSLSGRASPLEVSTGEPLETKSGPRDAHKLKRRSDVETTMFADACTTLRSILGADAACIVDLRDYQLFIRKTPSTGSTPAAPEAGAGEPGDSPVGTKENIIHSFLSGKPWPDSTEPVVNARHPSASVLGSSGSGFAFDAPGASGTLARYVSFYLRHRRFWWDREDAGDALASQLLLLMPAGTQTVLANVFLTWNGTLQFAAFVAWDRPPALFDDTSRLAMPFVYIVGAALVSSMAVVRMRGIEESQISYSNLQAHELRTPLHQILAITQLLRSSMRDMAAADEGAAGTAGAAASLAPVPSAPGAASDPTLGVPRAPGPGARPGGPTAATLQQVRDLLPFLDAIDTSGKILHGIVDNILTFLDLTDKDAGPAGAGSGAGELGSLGGNGGRTPLPLGALLEELIRDAYEADKLSRSSLGGGAGGASGVGGAGSAAAPRITKSTIFEVIPAGLGDAVMEDEGGALRRALQRVLANAYRYLDDGGCVEIYLDDVHSLLPPEGCEALQPSVRRVSLKIIDSGRGMSTRFVKERLGEPWAKEDPYATGSGLSVHLAYRIIELMGGYMEISSAPGKGCSVSIEVPLPTAAASPPVVAPAPLPTPSAGLEAKRTVAVLGFRRFHDPHCALKRIGAMLERTYAKLGYAVVPDGAGADLVVVEGSLALAPEGVALLGPLRGELVLFVGEESESAPFARTVALLSRGRSVRVLREPLTPAAIAASAASAPARSLAPVPEAEADADADAGAWRPRNVAESIAALCLGDYFSSRRSAPPPPPGAGPASALSLSSSSSFPSSARGSASSASGTGTGAGATPSTPPSSASSPSPAGRERAPEYSPVFEDAGAAEDAPLPPPAGVAVLVVEDNVVNRKILVKILRQALGAECELAEAPDGRAALQLFRALSRRAPVIVLLDINMPVLDGWAAASEMRALERARDTGRAHCGRGTPHAGASKIFAVTALAGENEKRRGLVECGFDGWLTKPCDRDTLCRVVEGARRELLGLAA